MDESTIRIARQMASRAMSKRNHFEFMADSLTNSYNERDAGLRKAYDEAARAFGELAYQIADQFSIPEREIAAAEGAQGASDGEFVARIEGIDEYGPRLEWNKHWVEVGIGTKLYTTPPPATGSTESAVTSELIRQIRARDAKGRAKYGVTLDRADLSHNDWLQHMAEELMDAAGYALAAKRTAPATGSGGEVPHG